MLDHAKLKAVRDIYLIARRNGLPPPRAQYHAARKARDLGCLEIRKYVNLVVQIVEGDES